MIRLIIVCLLFVCTTAPCQTANRDSTAISGALSEMENKMWGNYPLEFARARALHDKALESDCKGCQARSHKLIGKFLWANGQYDEGMIHFRKAEKLAMIAGDRAALASTIDLMGNTFYYQAYYDSAIYFFNRSLNQFEQGNDIQGMITVLHNISLMYHRKGNFAKSIEYLFREEQLKDQLPNSSHEIEALGAMGNLMVDSLYYIEEISDEKKALKEFVRTNDKLAIQRAYRNIGKAYRQLEDYQMAARYFVMAGRMSSDLGLIPEWDLAATDYRDAGMKDSAFHFHYLAKLEFPRTTQPNVAYTLELIGDAHSYFNRPDSARLYYDSALRMSYSMNNRITYTGIHRYLVDIHTRLGNYKEAERHLLTGLRLAKEVALIHERNLYREGEKLYEKTGNFREAFIYSQKYRLMSDSLHQAETALDLTRMQAEFKTAKRTREVEELRQQNLLNEARVEARNLQIALALLLVAIVALIGGLYYSRYRQKVKMNIGLENSNREKQVLLHEIHHRVKNNLQIISSLINLKAPQAGDDSNSALQQINSRIFSMGLIHEKLYQGENLRNIRLDEYLGEVSQHLLSSFEVPGKPVELNLDCSPVEVDADRALTCCLIANEIVTNTIKHAFEKDQAHREVAIGLGVTEQTIRLRIADNGKGTDNPDQIKKSFGLRFVHQLVSSKLDGHWAINGKGGFEITIDFPSERKITSKAFG